MIKKYEHPEMSLKQFAVNDIITMSLTEDPLADDMLWDKLN